MNKLSKLRSSVFAAICGVLSAGGGSAAFAVDQLYWVESAEIRRVGVDGTGSQQVLSAEESHATISIALDRGNDAMFWAAADEPYSQSIWRATLEGDDIVSLGYGWSEGLGYLTADSANARIYYTDPSDCVPDCGSINRIDQDGSDHELILQQDTPFAIALYPAGGTMCWGDDHNRWIRCSNLDGSAIQTVVTDAAVQGLAIDPTSAKLYWTDPDAQSIRRASMDGSDVEDLVAGLEHPWGIALDPASNRMYWTDKDVGKIQGAGLDGSNVTDILTGLNSPRGIAFLPQTGDMVPAVSTWGLIGLGLLLLAGSTVVLLRQRRRVTN